jgi:carnitine 3-dehydrogenase
MKPQKYLAPQEVKSVAVIGAGAVGASWASLFLAHGMQVLVHDPAADAEHRVRDFIGSAWPALRQLGVTAMEAPPLELLKFAKDAAAAAREADLVQENTPERMDLKAQVLREIDAAASPDKIILSSTGGLPPSQLQAMCAHPERLVVMHPFSPSHLMPLVEVIGGKRTAPEVIEWAVAFARHLGKHPIRLNAEASGHMTNRLQFALVREAARCLADGIASASDIDAAVRFGLAPRWMLMGGLLTLHLAGGAGGMQGILNHAGEAIESWWQPGGDLRLTPELKQRMIEAAGELSAGHSVTEWAGWRDRQLVRVLSLQQATVAEEPPMPIQDPQ